MLCFRTLSVAKKFMDKKVGAGLSRFSAESFLSHSTEILVGKLFCAVFQKISVREKIYG